MCELMIRLEDKRNSDDTRWFRKWDVIDIFEDGKFPDKLAWPHAALKIPGLGKSEVMKLLEQDQIVIGDIPGTFRIRKRVLNDVSIPVVTKQSLLTDREATITVEQLNSMVWNRNTGELESIVIAPLAMAQELPTEKTANEKSERVAEYIRQALPLFEPMKSKELRIDKKIINKALKR